MAAKLLLRLVLVCGLLGCLPLLAQDLQSAPEQKPAILPTQNLAAPADWASLQSAFRLHTLWMPAAAPGYIPLRLTGAPAGFVRTSWRTSPNTIDRMEAAFYCNDTPFVDQVRLPLATFWSGRVKLTGFESDITTANFVLGLPGQGSLHNLSAFGNAFVATHTPPSDQIAGINMTISLRPRDADAFDNSGRRGIEYLVKASRGFLPFLGARSDSISFSAR
jgi:hypothetical protein